MFEVRRSDQNGMNTLYAATQGETSTVFLKGTGTLWHRRFTGRQAVERQLKPTRLSSKKFVDTHDWRKDRNGFVN